MSVCIIAELGINHDGQLGKAMHLMREAKRCGADVAKFQTYDAQEITLPGPHRDMLAKYQLSHDDHRALKAEADILGIEFMSSPFDIKSAVFLKELGVKRLKIGSGELTNLEFLGQVSDLGLAVILSTGMATSDEVKDAAETMGACDCAWLHCVSAYPAPVRGYNLLAMQCIKDIVCGEPVGLSDHTLGDHLAIAAVAMGATIIEKHLTLCFEDIGPDHAASMEPFEFGEMVRKIRDVESAMGDGIKRPTPEELLIMPRARRVQTAEGFKRNP
jgi:N,N'-diacetyllegionaminate synthase